MKTTNPDLLVVTSYPEKGLTHGKETVGVASYTKNTVRALLQSFNHNTKPIVIILAEQLSGKETYSEDGIVVNRVWKRNSLFVFWTLLKTILSYKTPWIVIEFEFALFGGIWTVACFPLFLLLLSLCRKKVYLVLHQVVVDANTIAPHVGMSQNTLLTVVFSFIFRIWNTIVVNLSYNIIVFEEFLKEQLGGSRKIAVIPHGVEEVTHEIRQSKAREQLHIENDAFVLLYFGYITWYKGADWLVKEIANLSTKTINGKKLKLIVAGGPNPNHLNKSYYNNYVDEIKRLAGQNNSIIYTGYIKEKDISLYFQASDLVVFPYRTFMSSSGPLSIAFAYKKPVLLSDKLRNYAKTSDFHNSMMKAGISSREIFFSLNEKDLMQKISLTIHHTPELKVFSSIMKTQRSFTRIGILYKQLLFS
jgi:glycosyltransferase involved in cell wall biosynthesis